MVRSGTVVLKVEREVEVEWKWKFVVRCLVGGILGFGEEVDGGWVAPKGDMYVYIYRGLVGNGRL